MGKCVFWNEDDRCGRFESRPHCGGDRIFASYYTDEFTALDPSETCEHMSIFGNSYLKITKAQIDELLDGKVLWYDDGEYGTFVRFVNEEN